MIQFINKEGNLENVYREIAKTFGGGKKYCEIIQPRLSTGRLKNKPDWVYVKNRNKREFQLDEKDLKRRSEIFSAYFQPERKVSQVFTPTNKYLFQKVMEGKPLTKIYKGVSFNPLLNDYGERFDNLDFFSWIKRVQEKIPMEFYVLDAGTYWLINALQEDPKFRYSPNVAEEFVDFLLEKLETPRGQEISKMAEMRNKYLRAMGELLEPNSYVIPATSLWEGKDSDYMECLQKAIEFCMKPVVGEFDIDGVKKVEPLFDEYADKVPKELLVEIDKFVKYRSYNKDFEKWYTPLVVAEALYLYDKFGVNAKLGPTSERSFDDTIRKSIRKYRNSQYPVIWYTRPFDGKMEYEERIFFNDKPEKVEEKLSNNKPLRMWMAEITTPFSNRRGLNKTKKLAEEISNLKERINNRVEELYNLNI